MDNIEEYRKIYQSLSIEDKISFISKLSPDAINELRYFSNFTLRDKQIVPDDWKGRYYIVLSGRGWGKSKMGAKWIQTKVYKKQKGLAIVAPNYKDLEEVMVPAILDEFPPEHKPKYLSGNKAKIKCHNGIEILCYTSEQEIRGGNFSAIWIDEVAKFCDSIPEKTEERFQVLDFACRKGDSQFLITTTPKPWNLFFKWKKRFDNNDPLIKIVTGTMEENTALSNTAKQALYSEYGGTRLGRQELEGELLEDTPGALWHTSIIDKYRVSQAPQLIRIVVAVDPAVTDGKDSDETGLVVAGIDNKGHAYVIEDVTGKYSPDQWAKLTISLFNKYKADRIIAESNQGGQLVAANLRTVHQNAPIKLIHASKGKITRAEPVASLYEQGKVHHVGYFQKLERQMCTYTGNQKEKSPDAMDALVYSITELILSQSYIARSASNVPVF